MNWQSSSSSLLGFLLLTVGSTGFAVGRVPAADFPALRIMNLPQDATVGVTASQLSRALTMVAETHAWKPQVNDEISRGPAAVIYPKVAPAIVVVRTPAGHGTGFIIDAAGWIVTNHHVIEGGDVALPSGALKVTVHLGRLDDGLMSLDQRGIDAMVYKTDEEKDLALLKLSRIPKSVDALPVVPLADKGATPGSDCVLIGHPAAGLLWTVRSGEVSGVATWPGEMVDVVVARLAMPTFRRQLAKLLDSAPQRKVLVSSCGSNPGDSGSPLLNERGELIAVTFAVPMGGAAQGISLAKFTYHVHLDEVRKFIRDRPREAPLYVPDPWPIAMFSTLMDSDGDQKADMWMFAMRPDQPMTGYLLDLDQDTPASFPQEYVEQPAVRAAWDFEFGFQQFPLLRTFYDTDNDGTVDLILTDTKADGMADLVLKQRRGRWDSAAARDQAMFDPSLFKDKRLRGRFTKVLASEPQPLALLEKAERPVASLGAGSETAGGDTSADNSDTGPPLRFLATVAGIVLVLGALLYLRRRAAVSR